MYGLLIVLPLYQDQLYQTHNWHLASQVEPSIILICSYLVLICLFLKSKSGPHIVIVNE